MAILNKVFLIGRLGQDPEVKQTPNGKSVLNITIATSDFFKDQSGNKQTKTEWHRVVLWENTANLVGRYCRKGSQLMVEGSLHTKKWQDKNGNEQYTTEILGRSIQFLDSKGTGGQAPGNYGAGAKSNYPPDDSMNVKKKPFDTSKGADDEFVKDDVPF